MKRGSTVRMREGEEEKKKKKGKCDTYDTFSGFLKKINGKRLKWLT